MFTYFKFSLIYITSFFVTLFAEYSNYINQKKNEINKKQEGARKLLVEFAREIEASCQGNKRRILRKPEQRARARRLLDVLDCCCNGHSLIPEVSKDGKRTKISQKAKDVWAKSTSLKREKYFLSTMGSVLWGAWAGKLQKKLWYDLIIMIQNCVLLYRQPICFVREWASFRCSY